MESAVIVEFQGFKDGLNNFIVKELCVLTEYRSDLLVFKPPYDLQQLAPERIRSNTWCTNHLHGFYWNDGSCPYGDFEMVLRKRCKDFQKVYTKGSEKAKFLQTLLTDKFVIDFDEVVTESFNSLPEPKIECWYGHVGSCALINAYKILEWFEKEQHK